MRIHTLTCPACGATFEIEQNSTRARCAYCDTHIVLSSLDENVFHAAEMQKLVLIQQLSITQSRLTDLRAEKRRLEGLGRTRQASKQLRVLQAGESKLAQRVRTLRAEILALDPESDILPLVKIDSISGPKLLFQPQGKSQLNIARGLGYALGTFLLVPMLMMPIVAVEQAIFTSLTGSNGMGMLSLLTSLLTFVLPWFAFAYFRQPEHTLRTLQAELRSGFSSKR